MKQEMVLLAFLGAVGWASAISGISAIHSHGSGLVVTLHPDIVSRIWAGLWGAIFWTLTFGIHRRHIAAYYGWLALLAVSCLGMLIVGIPRIISLSQLPVGLVAIAVIGAVVGVAWTLTHWGRWWHRQRGHFDRNGG